MRILLVFLTVSFLFAGCATSGKTTYYQTSSSSYTAPPDTKVTVDEKDETQQKIDAHVEKLQKERSAKFRLRSLFGGR